MKTISSAAERLEKHSRREGECVVWIRFRGYNGYGQISVHGRRSLTHRVAWEVVNGPIPEGLCVLHSCDNPPCIRIEHLFLGTKLDNVKDMVNKKRQAFGDRNGSRLHPERLARGERHSSYLHPELCARGDRHGSKTHPERLARGDRHGSRTHPEKIVRGESHPKAKLNLLSVSTLRADYARGGVSTVDLAKVYGVTRQAILSVIKRETWK